MRSWSIIHGRLVLVGPEGPTIATADEIFRSVIERESVWPDVEPGQSGVAATFRFSRYPALPIGILSADTKGPILTFEAAISDVRRIPLSASELAAGHLIFDGVWYPLDPTTAQEVVALAHKAGAEAGGAVRSFRSILDLKQAAAGGSSLEDRLPIGPETASLLAPPVTGSPVGIEAELYSYQLDGWRWLRFVLAEGAGGLLGDEMGLGKTLQVISAITDAGVRPLCPVLVVAPGSLLENWRREIARFSPRLSVLKHHGPDRTGRPVELQRYDVVITSYDSVLRDSALLLMLDWTLVVLDEAQNIKNPDALRTRAVKELHRSSGLAVTGTPMENRLMDLWSIMDFVCPGYLGDQLTFSQTFVDSPDGAERLEPLLSPLMLRRRIKDVAKDLPERIDIPEALELEPYEANAYDVIRKRIAAQYGKSASIVVLTKLRMFCAHQSLADEDWTGDPSSFSKMRRLLEILEEVFSRGEKALVFASFTKMADLIVEQVHSKFGIFARSLDGRLPIDDRQPLIDEFSNVTGAAALVLNPRAGGAGLNITAANHVIHYNLEWNPAIEAQASARAHRRGQTLPVTVHRLFYAGTVEEVVDERLRRKRQLADAAIIGVQGGEDDLADVMAALERSPLGRSGARPR